MASKAAVRAKLDAAAETAAKRVRADGLSFALNMLLMNS